MVLFGARRLHIMVDDAPNQCVMLIDHAGHREDRQCAFNSCANGLGEHHDQRLEQQGEAAVMRFQLLRHRSGPGNRNAVDAALCTLDAGSPGVEESLVLEKVNALSTLAPQVPPSQILRVVGLAWNPANRTRKGAAPRKIQMDIQWRKSGATGWAGLHNL